MQITSLVTIPVERDGTYVGEFHFSPTDLAFAERAYGLLSRFSELKNEFQTRAAAIENEEETDSYGLPKNLPGRIALEREICEELHVGIDLIFGSGVSAMVFGEAISMDTIVQFFDEITPHIGKAAKDRTDRHLNRAQRREALKK